MQKKIISLESSTSDKVYKKLINKPKWIKSLIPSGKDYINLKKLTKKNNLHTVCEEARCPNLGECWSKGTLTFMILGDTCTRTVVFVQLKLDSEDQ